MDHPIDRVFGPGGLLSSHLDGYEARPQQVEMARQVHEVFGGDGRVVIEAATGTGKTLAYLIPAILSGRRVLVSTATKALQEQIFNKDIPFLQELFKHASPRRAFKAITVKGRSNYLCKLRFEQFSSVMTFKKKADVAMFSRVRRWARSTKTGDRSEVQGLPDDFEPWQHVSATAQQCHGHDCRHFEECFVTRLRREAREADLVVVNHHLFFADLAIKGTGTAEVLPEDDAVVFDEAHHLEQIITSFFGLQVSNYRLVELASDLRRDLEAEGGMTLQGARRVEEAEHFGALFFEAFDVPDGRHALDEILRGRQGVEIAARFGTLMGALSDLAGWVETSNAGELSERLHARCVELHDDLEDLMGMKQPTMVYIVERRGRGLFLEASPVDVANLFRRKVLSLPGPQVYTSATLTTGGSFDYLMGRLGMEGLANVKTLELPPVFDYENRALIYVPNRLPEPNHPRFLDGVCQIVEYLIETTEGRAFVLFTSYRNMDEVHARLKDKITHMILKQGEAPRHELLEQFREDIHSVLFGTSSFWEGVDVEGEALSLVIIDKLPFGSPADPLTRARVKLIESQGMDPFRTYFVPSAAITLKQGFGRLIRSRRDQGIVAILDSRLASKNYGRTFLDSLPPAPVVWNAKEVRNWWQQRHPPAPAQAETLPIKTMASPLIAPSEEPSSGAIASVSAPTSPDPAPVALEPR